MAVRHVCTYGSMQLCPSCTCKHEEQSSDAAVVALNQYQVLLVPFLQLHKDLEPALGNTWSTPDTRAHCHCDLETALDVLEQKVTPWWAMDDNACCEVLKFLVPAKELEFPQAGV